MGNVQAIEHEFDTVDIAYVAEHLTIDQITAALRRSKYLENMHNGCIGFNTYEVVFEREIQYLLKGALDQIRSRQVVKNEQPGQKIDIRNLKEHLDIVDVISQYMDLKKAGRNFSALCPFHSEKKPSFIVYPDKQTWHCFGACSTGGDVIKFVMRYENCDFITAVRRLSENK